jgi:hypothetical protein
MSKILEVGDEVVCVQWTHLCGNNYYIESITHVTKMRAITSGGTTLLRNPDKNNKYRVYGEIKNRGYWVFANENLKNEIISHNKHTDYVRKINNWFRSFKPDFATKEALYKQFNQ